MLVDNALIVVANSGLLSPVVYGVVVLIQVIQGRVFVRRWGSNFSGWRLPPILGFAERIPALCFDDRGHKILSCHLGVRVGSWSRQLFTSSESLITLRESSSHGVFERGTELLENHKLIFSELLLVSLLEVSSWAWETVISSLLNIIDEKFLHIVSSNTYAILLISLTTILSERVTQVIVEWRWQFSTLIFRWVVAEPLCRVEEWSTIASVLLLAEQVVSVVSNLLIKSSVVWEPLTLGELEHGL